MEILLTILFIVFVIPLAGIMLLVTMVIVTGFMLACVIILFPNLSREDDFENDELLPRRKE